MVLRAVPRRTVMQYSMPAPSSPSFKGARTRESTSTWSSELLASSLSSTATMCVASSTLTHTLTKVAALPRHHQSTLEKPFGGGRLFLLKCPEGSFSPPSVAARDAACIFPGREIPGGEHHPLMDFFPLVRRGQYFLGQEYFAIDFYGRGGTVCVLPSFGGGV